MSKPDFNETEAPADEGKVPPLTEEQRALVAKLVADGLSSQHKFRPERLYKTTGKGYYDTNTVEEIRQARDKDDSRNNEAGTTACLLRVQRFHG
jgi:hypothetical protein